MDTINIIILKNITSILSIIVILGVLIIRYLNRNYFYQIERVALGITIRDLIF